MTHNFAFYGCCVLESREHIIQVGAATTTASLTLHACTYTFPSNSAALSEFGYIQPSYRAYPNTSEIWRKYETVQFRRSAQEDVQIVAGCESAQ